MNLASLITQQRALRGTIKRRICMTLSSFAYLCIIVFFVSHNFWKEDNVIIEDANSDAAVEVEAQEVFDVPKNVSVHNRGRYYVTGGGARRRSEPEIIFFVILCEGKPKASQGGKEASAISRQLRQAAVMLKSAVALTSRKLRFLVAADSKKLYQKFAEIPSSYPTEYQKRIAFEYRDVWYPPDRQDMRNMFRVCATERLFLPDMFPELDAAIYIDTDLIFLRPPEDLWDEFDRFNGKQLAAMAPCLYHYGTTKNKVPFYGTSGLNAGIMHMNLTRMKDFPGGGWIPANMKVFDNYKKIIKLADQDILNILFNKHPDLLYELGCQWNYRLWQCTQGRNLCPQAATDGASIIHGNAMAFVNGAEMKLQVVFEAWENHVLGSSLKELLALIKKDLVAVSKMGKQSKCAKIREIDDILSKELQRHVVDRY